MSLRTQIEERVTAGQITQARADRLLDRLAGANIDVDVIDGTSFEVLDDGVFVLEYKPMSATHRTTFDTRADATEPMRTEEL